MVSTSVTSTHTLQDVAYGDGVFAFVGHAPINGNVVIYTSSTGLSWTNYSSGSGLDSWKDFRCIYHTGEHFVASGFASRACYSLDFAQTWETDQTGDRYTMAAFASGGGIVYTVGINEDDGDADIDLVSTDGKSWTVINPGLLANRNDITFFKNTFISVGDAGSIRQSAVIAPNTNYADFTSTYFPGGGNDALPTSNPDGDWANNLFEFALGGDPTALNSAPARPILSFDSSGNPVFEVSRITKHSDVAYSVWWSTDLSSWTRNGLTVVTDNATLLKVVADEHDVSEGKGFFKLQIDQ